jgi:hypothetical protein
MSDAVSEGREAWTRLKDRERATWDDWIAVGKALIIGRASCMSMAQTNAPQGGRYKAAMNCWLADNGLAEVSGPERFKLSMIMKNLDAVEAWRTTLDPAERRRLNHPSLWFTFCKATRGEAPPRVRVRRPVASSGRLPPGKPIYWQQDHVRRAADAMRESGSNDFFILARLALEAAVRSEDDLIEMISAERKRGPASKAPARELQTRRHDDDHDRHGEVLRRRPRLRLHQAG